MIYYFTLISFAEQLERKEFYAACFEAWKP